MSLERRIDLLHDAESIRIEGRVAQVVGLEDESGEGFLRWLRELKARIGIPADLKAAGVSRAELDRLSDLAFQDTCHLNNPRPVRQDDFRRIYSESLA